MKLTEKQKRHIAKIINRKLSYTNGWRITDGEYEMECINTAQKIAQYLTNFQNRSMFDK